MYTFRRRGKGPVGEKRKEGEDTRARLLVINEMNFFYRVTCQRRCTGRTFG